MNIMEGGSNYNPFELIHTVSNTTKESSWSFSQFSDFYSNFPIWGKVLFWFVLMMLIHLFGPWGSGMKNYIREGFSGDDGTGGKDFLTKRGLDIYDSFYASVYDDLVYDPRKNNYEIVEIRRATKMEPDSSIILDIGCGTGHHCGALNSNGFNITGIDQSEAMIKRAQKRFPGIDLSVANALNSMTFPADAFTHILCLYFTIYYIEDKPTFFQNCYHWLKSGGHLALHLVNRNKFDPIVAASNPLSMISPQKYAKERITTSVVKFKDAQYKAEFIPHNDRNFAEFNETFKNDATGHVRQNEHLLYMPSQKAILQMAQDAGFILNGKIDMVACQYEYQYIYILYKPE